MTSITEIMQLCRLCLVKEQVNIPIFEEQGDLQQIIEKISACLPVKVSKEDKLPKKICDGCSYKLELLYQFRNTTVTAEKQLLSWINQLGGNKVENEVKSQPATQHIVKEEVEIVDTADHPDTEYLLGQQITFEGGDTPFLESQDDNGAGDDDITNSSDDEPLAKRRKRLLEDQGQISAGESKEEVVQHMAVTKTEDASDSEGEENVDDPEPNFVSVGTDDIQQPGPSGVGKAATTDIPNQKIVAQNSKEMELAEENPLNDLEFIKTEPLIYDCYDQLEEELVTNVTVPSNVMLFPPPLVHISPDNENKLKEIKKLKAPVRKKMVTIRREEKINLPPPPLVQLSLSHNLNVRKPSVSKPFLDKRKNTLSNQTKRFKSTASKKAVDVPPLVRFCDSKLANQVSTKILLESNNKSDFCAISTDTLINSITQEPFLNVKKENIATIKGVNEVRMSPPPLVEIPKNNTRARKVQPKNKEASTSKLYADDIPPLVIISNKKTCKTSCADEEHLKDPINSFQPLSNYTNSIFDINREDNSSCGYYVKRPEPNSTNESYICLTCNYEMRDEDTMKQHVSFHRKKFQCITCSKCFKDAYEFALHNNPQENMQFKCPECLFTTKRESALRSHINYVHFLRNDCIYCGVLITDVEEREIHDQTHERQDNSIICDICGEFFKNKFNLKMHYRTHTGEKPFSCSHCNKKLSSKHSLISHQQIHNRRFSCDRCRQGFGTWSRLHCHQRRCQKGKFNCSKCNMRFTIKTNMLSHYAKCQSSEMYPCRHCKRQFRDPYRCSVHMQTHSRGLFVCPLCDYNIADKSDMLQHITEVHPNNPLYDFKCVVCDRNFHYPIRLYEHQIVNHTVTIVGAALNKKRYICDVCGKSLRTKANLLDHYDTHVTEKPFSCRLCNKQFDSSLLAKQHEKTHDRKKIHACKHCSRLYSKFEHLREHLITSHKEEYPHVCAGCDTGFSTEHQLQAHLDNCEVVFDRK